MGYRKPIEKKEMFLGDGKSIDQSPGQNSDFVFNSPFHLTLLGTSKDPKRTKGIFLSISPPLGEQTLILDLKKEDITL